MPKQISKAKALRNFTRELINVVGHAEHKTRLKDGKAKKAYVKRVLHALIRNVDIPFVPDWLEGLIYRRLIDALIDVLVELFNKMGWPQGTDTLMVEK